MAIVVFLLACAFLPLTGLLRLLRLMGFAAAIAFLAYGMLDDAVLAAGGGALAWAGIFARRMRLEAAAA